MTAYNTRYYIAEQSVLIAVTMSLGSRLHAHAMPDDKMNVLHACNEFEVFKMSGKLLQIYPISKEFYQKVDQGRSRQNS
jgi:hypothetical protein